MKEQVKTLYLKALLIGIKGIIVLPLIIFLIYEAFITQNQEAEMSHVQYVAVITTLCWILVLWTFVDYKLKHYLFSVLVITVFLQMYFFNIHIRKAHRLDSCTDKGYVWDYDRHVCRTDCLTWNAVQKCVQF